MTAAQKQYLVEVLGLKRLIRPESYIPRGGEVAEERLAIPEKPGPEVIIEGGVHNNLLVWTGQIPSQSERKLLTKILASIQYSQFALGFSGDKPTPVDLLTHWKPDLLKAHVLVFGLPEAERLLGQNRVKLQHKEFIGHDLSWWCTHALEELLEAGSAEVLQKNKAQTWQMLKQLKRRIGGVH